MTTARVENPGKREAILRVLGADMPAALWPSDNAYGIPTLDPAQQAGPFVDAPLARWGRETRKARMRGTWHFYTDDYRFTRLLERPQDVINSACVAAVEPNFSVHAQTPRALVLYRTHEKRRLARLWQAHGIKILVDLHVAEEHAEDNLLGVPRGWRSYATRGSTSPAQLEREYELAVKHAGSPMGLLFLVYGGGRRAREISATNGWLWQPEEADAVRRT